MQCHGVAMSTRSRSRELETALLTYRWVQNDERNILI